MCGHGYSLGSRESTKNFFLDHLASGLTNIMSSILTVNSTG